MELGKLEEAEEIGEREEFIHNPIIQNQLITVKMKLGKIEEAEEIGEREEFIHNPIIQSQLITVKMKLRKLEETEKPRILSQIATKLYYDKIEEHDIEEVKNSKEISEFERTTMLLAIYEKKNAVSKAKQLVKQYKRENPNSEESKTLNIIMQRIENKKLKIFDYGFYGELLHWGIDKNLKEKFEQEKEVKKITKRKDILVKSEKNDEYNIKETEDRNTEFYQRKQDFAKRIKAKPTSNKNVKNTQQQIKEKGNHCEEMIHFLNKQKALIYVRLQSNNDNIQRTAITQWDKMENLIERVRANRKEDKEYLNNLYKKIQKLKEKSMEK